MVCGLPSAWHTEAVEGPPWSVWAQEIECSTQMCQEVEWKFCSHFKLYMNASSGLNTLTNNNESEVVSDGSVWWWDKQEQISTKLIIYSKMFDEKLGRFPRMLDTFCESFWWKPGWRLTVRSTYWSCGGSSWGVWDSTYLWQRPSKSEIWEKMCQEVEWKFRSSFTWYMNASSRLSIRKGLPWRWSLYR